MAHERLLATRNGYTWVHKYVFPGGALPSMTAIDQVVSDHTSLRIQETRRLGLSYVPTLQQWRHIFNDRLPEVVALGFDETFIRMWNFYLAYSRPASPPTTWTTCRSGSPVSSGTWVGGRAGREVTSRRRAPRARAPR